MERENKRKRKRKRRKVQATNLHVPITPGYVLLLLIILLSHGDAPSESGKMNKV